MASNTSQSKTSSKPIPRHVDVLVVGAGPTGLTLALALEQAGVDYLLIDRAPEPGADPRASLLHVRSMELLAGLGVGDDLTKQAAPINVASYYDAGLGVCDLDFAELGSTVEHALGVSQAVIEAVLVDHLEQSGGSVHRPVTMDSYELTDDGVSALLSRRGRRRTRVSARFVVGCDGATSAVREQAGLGGNDREITDSFVTATVELSSELDRSALHLFAADKGFLVLSPLPDHAWRLTASMASSGPAPTPEQLQLLISDRGPRTSSVTMGRPIDIGRYRLRRGVARYLVDGPVVLAGDAAHTFSPAGGQGMNTGLADAANLGWKLAAICLGQAELELLRTYDEERRRAARDAVNRVDRFGGALTMHNPVARGLRDALAVLAGRVKALGTPVLRGLSGFDTTYEHGAVKSGRGGGYGWGTIGERCEFVEPSALADRAHHILVADPADVVKYKELADRFEVPLTVDVVSGRPSGVCLVRPDGHIGWSGRGREQDSLAAHLDRWFLRR